jgi:hypothetical protein
MVHEKKETRKYLAQKLGSTNNIHKLNNNNKEFIIIYPSSNVGEKRNAYRILVGNPEGKRPLGRPRRRWLDNIKMNLREIGWDGMDWIDLTQDRDLWRALVNAVMNLRVP